MNNVSYEVVAQGGLFSSEPIYKSQWTCRAAASLELSTLIELGTYDMIFIRQYYTDRFGRSQFRVLHNLTWRKA